MQYFDTYMQPLNRVHFNEYEIELIDWALKLAFISGEQKGIKEYNDKIKQLLTTYEK